MFLIKKCPSLSDLVNRYKIESFGFNKAMTVFWTGFFSKSLTCPESDPFWEKDENENTAFEEMTADGIRFTPMKMIL